MRNPILQLTNKKRSFTDSQYLDLVYHHQLIPFDITDYQIRYSLQMAIINNKPKSYSKIRQNHLNTLKNSILTLI
jgi:hypothetical protein